jgi:acetyltransferase-like isoleucine patch superfamily enzyme
MKLLSICIPTFNRAFYLRRTLKNITRDRCFTDGNEIEIIISDNCSSDITPIIASEFVKDFPGKIHYFRNDTNIEDENFAKALSYGEGRLLKLHNDTLLFREGALSRIVQYAKNGNGSDLLFCANGNGCCLGNETKSCSNLKEFIQAVSYFCGWIGGFCIWKSDFVTLASSFSRNVHTKLVQVDVLFRLLVEHGRNSLIDNKQLFIVQTVSRKKWYNVAEIIGGYYYQFLLNYAESGCLNGLILKNERCRILREFIAPNYFSDAHCFSRTGFFKYLKHWWMDGFFYVEMVKILGKRLKKWVKKTIRGKFKPDNFQNSWRKSNQHNATTVKRTFDLDRVFVGRRTYGEIDVFMSGNSTATLMIGDFCSIDPNVTFVLESEHFMSGVSTFPFKVMVRHDSCEAISKGSIIVDDDVLIGYGATIISGVRIGQGAIIAAQSIVTRDVPPYAIVAGNPAKVIKYRFSEKIRQKLINFDFTILEDESIIQNIDRFYVELTDENIDEVISKM